VRPGEHGGIFLRLLFLIVCLGFLALLFAVRHPMLRLAGQLWLINEPEVKTDVIIVLGDDNYQGDRAFHAAGLYRAGIAPLVVASGRSLRSYAGMDGMMERDLESYGVPATSIVKFAYRGPSTRQEAEALAELVARRGWKSVLLVTSNYDARRARFIFGRVFPATVSVHASGARDSDFDASRWWETGVGQRIFLSELLGYVVAVWELRGKSDTRTGAAILFSPSFAPAALTLPIRQVSTWYCLPYLIGNMRS
jgi:uncharacterized SAM-binding protein YcdF (DUF218 family)